MNSWKDQQKSMWHSSTILFTFTVMAMYFPTWGIRLYQLFVPAWVALLSTGSYATAQNLFVTGRIGLSNYQGDLQQQQFSMQQAKLAGSLGVQYDITEHFSARSFVSYSILTAADANNKSSSLQQRNLSFDTRLWEWELGGQYNLFSLNNRWWTPYVFAGVSLFHIKPASITNSGDRVFLQPLSTEGQGFVEGRTPYRSLQAAIPFGIGAVYALTEDVRLGIEFGYRRTFTDYIDDVSTTYVDPLLLQNRGATAVEMAYRGRGAYPNSGTTRGSAQNRDAFYFMQLSLTIRPFVDWYKRTSGVPGLKKDKRVGCPMNRVY